MKDTKYYSLDEAARILSRTKKTLSKYIKQGRLRSVRKGNRIFIPAEDVKEFLEEQLEPTRKFSWKEFEKFRREMEARITRLEDTITRALQLLGIAQIPSKPLTDFELHKAYEAAFDMLAKDLNSVKIKEIQTWSDILARINEQSLMRLAYIQEHTEVWKPFLELARRLHEHVTSLPEYPKDHNLRDLGWSLSQSRAILKGLALTTIASTPKWRRYNLPKQKIFDFMTAKLA